MKLLIERELFEQCINLLDNIENDKGCIPENLWNDRNRLLESAKAIGCDVKNAPKNPTANFKQKL